MLYKIQSLRRKIIKNIFTCVIPINQKTNVKIKNYQFNLLKKYQIKNNAYIYRAGPIPNVPVLLVQEGT